MHADRRFDKHTKKAVWLVLYSKRAYGLPAKHREGGRGGGYVVTKRRSEMRKTGTQGARSRPLCADTCLFYFVHAYVCMYVRMCALTRTMHNTYIDTSRQKRRKYKKGKKKKTAAHLAT